MRAHPHVPRFAIERRWPRLSARVTIGLTLALYFGVYMLRAGDPNAVDGEDVLLALPLAALALKFGVRGGLAGALLGLVLVGVWDAQDGDIGIEPEGYLSWGATFLLLGALIGFFVEHRRRLESHISRYFDDALDLLATVDLDGKFVRVNKAWERALGYSVESICSQPFIEFVHPDDREATLAENATVAEGARDAVGFRNRYRTADGSYRWLEWSGHMSSSEGVINAVARDVTDQVEAEKQLACQAQLLETKVAERTRELEDARAKTLKRLALAAEYRDDDTFEHTERVGAMSARLAVWLDLDTEQVDILRLAAPLHDVGKIGIPDRILLKPGKLTAEEYEVMKGHTTLGARLLTGSGSPVLQMATLIAESHHERWDGAGYPHGLAGEAIPLVGRIVAVADVFDALTHERPYKSAWPAARAAEEIACGSGSQFDPSVVRAFLAVHERNDDVPENEGLERSRTPSQQRRSRAAAGSALARAQ